MVAYSPRPFKIHLFLFCGWFHSQRPQFQTHFQDLALTCGEHLDSRGCGAIIMHGSMKYEIIWKFAYTIV